MVNPSIATAVPANASREMTTGRSTPPIGITVVRRTRARRRPR